MRLRAQSENEVQADEAKDDVGSPSRPKRTQIIHISKAFENPNSAPIKNDNTHAHAEPYKGSLFPHREGKGNPEQGYDKGNEWKGRFVLKVDFKSHCDKIFFFDLLNIFVQFSIVHLIRFFPILEEEIRVFDIGQNQILIFFVLNWPLAFKLPEP